MMSVGPAGEVVLLFLGGSLKKFADWLKEHFVGIYFWNFSFVDL